jgi:hypothetical protein
MYYAYYDVYLANLSSPDSGIDSALENELGGYSGAMDR